MIAALFWHVSINGTSIIIMLVVFISNFVEHMQTSALLPWVTSEIDPGLISTFMSGSNLGSVLAAMFGLIQQPGNANKTGNNGAIFTPTVYFLIIDCFIIISLIAFIIIDKIYLQKNVFRKYRNMNNNNSITTHVIIGNKNQNNKHSKNKNKHKNKNNEYKVTPFETIENIDNTTNKNENDEHNTINHNNNNDNNSKNNSQGKNEFEIAPQKSEGPIAKIAATTKRQQEIS